MLIYLNGLLLGLSLIMALGPQNIFLIKQGARRNHATLSAVVCFVCDMILVCASVTGLHELLLAHPSLQSWMIWLGSAFLLYYASKALINGLFQKKKDAQDAPPAHNKTQIILFAIGFSLLNPHAIIDSLVIIGSGSSQFPDHQGVFLLGVLTASLLWFSSLTLTTRYFSNVLSKDSVWNIIEISSGVLMAYIGISLALSNL